MITPEFGLDSSEVMEIINVGGEEIPPEYMKPHRLTRIRAAEFTRNGIYYLPLELEEFYNLDLLIVTHNPMEFLTSEIYTMKALRCLIISNCNLTHLPPSIARLHRLEAISVPNNKIEYVSPIIFEMPIIYINLNGNLIKRLEISRHKNLKTLVVSIADNPLEPENKGRALGKMGLLRVNNCQVIFFSAKQEEEARIAKLYNIPFILKMINRLREFFSSRIGIVCLLILFGTPPLLLDAFYAYKRSFNQQMDNDDD